jgi:hypothetical protein
MTSPSSALLLRFGTDFEGAKRSLTRLAATTTASMAEMAVSALTTTKSLRTLAQGATTMSSTLSTALKIFTTYKLAMGALALGSAAFGAASAAAADQVAKLDAIVAGAKAAGTDTTFFQAWIAQAQALGVEAKDLEHALAHLKEQSRATVDESGDRIASPIEKILYAMVSFKGVGAVNLAAFLGADTAIEKITAIVAQIKAAHDLAREVGDKDLTLWADKLATVSFGDTIGRNISDAVDQGTISLDGLVKMADGAGATFDAGLTARAKELNDELAQADALMADAMKPVLVELAQLGLDIKQGWADTYLFVARTAAAAVNFAASVRDIVGNLGKSVGLQEENARAALAAGLDARAGRVSNVLVYNPAAVSTDFMSPEQRAALGQASRGIRGGTFQPGTGGRAYDALAGGLAAGGLSRDFDTAFDHGGGGGRGHAGASPADQVKSYVDGLSRAIELLQAEAATEGKSNAEKEKAVDLVHAEQAARERGSALTQAEIAQVAKLAEEHAKLKDQIAAVKKAQEEAQAASKFFADTAYSAVERLLQPGAKFADVLKGIVTALEQAALKAALLGEGPLAGLFGSAGKGLFSGLFGGLLAPVQHAGGMAGFGPPRLVAASAFDHAPRFHSGIGGGEIAAILQAGETVLTAAQTTRVAQNLRGAAGPSLTTYTINAPYAQPGVAEQIRTEIERYDRARRLGGDATMRRRYA